MASDPISRLPLPDPRAARRALSEMRDAMRAGLGLMLETVEQAPLPSPVAAVAGTVLRRVDHLAQKADAAASTVVNGLMTATGIALDDPDDRDAAVLAAALRRALAELGARDLRVSETSVLEAVRATRREASRLGDDARAAELMRRLMAAGAVRPVAASSPTTAVPVAVFAAVLADLQAQAADPEGVAASVALADALAAEIRGAKDGVALARLFAEFRGHV